MITQTELCPCCSQKNFAHCCQPLLQGQPATSAEQLMRSRYTAYCVGDQAYLTRSECQASANETNIPNHEWISLQILATHKGSAKDKQGMVEFVAFYQGDHHHHHHDGECCDTDPQQLHERAYFIQKDGHWYYQSGELLPAIKIGRNQFCWCGSQKKFKQCHGR